ncbi:MAG: hypothetical protein L3V56_00715 [Candidatus Magnetoovum sp. WYHC-5]|nr:hypothetical protein [Candidatus Magnetoovum sp. WYHC-5]
MSVQVFSNKTIVMEEQRQRLLQDLINEYGTELESQYKPGSFGCHELLDRTAFVTNIIEKFLLNHPSCIQKKEWFYLVEKAVESLNELYQAIGQQHLINE